MIRRPIIEPSAVATLRELGGADDGAFLKEIIALFISDTLERIAQIEACLNSGDFDGLERTAHGVKGSSANVGATSMHGIAESLERDSRTRDKGKLEPQVGALKEEFVRARSALEEFARTGAIPAS